MSALATYTTGVGVLIALAAGWLGVQRLWLQVSSQAGETGAGRDALADRFSCGGDGECGACETPCERSRQRAARSAGGGNGA